MSLTNQLKKITQLFSGSFTKPTYNNFLILAAGCILTSKNRTICNILRIVSPFSHLDQSSFHRVFSSRKWSICALSKTLISYILNSFDFSNAVKIAVDDTVTQRFGPKVYGKGRHRDAVKSSHSYTAFKWGHKWIVLSVLIKFPFSKRFFALPVMAALYRSKEWNNVHGHRHKTPIEITTILLKKLIRWFPEKHFIIIGDAGFSSNAMAVFCQENRKNLSLIGKFPADANLYKPTPKREKGTNGRPRKKGDKLSSPKTVVVKIKNKIGLVLDWYGGKKRKVETVTSTGCWYKSGKGIVPIRWVYVCDLTGTHRDEYFFTTDLSLSAKEIIEFYTGRWSLETTFQECKEHLKIETARGYTEKTVLRVMPCLLCLYTIIVLFYSQLPKRIHEKFIVNWKGKSQVAFSDMISWARKLIWQYWVFEHPDNKGGLSKLSPKFKNTILDALILSG